jgi:putative transposase
MAILSRFGEIDGRSVDQEFNIHAHPAQRVCHEYVTRRIEQKKAWLHWRGGKFLGIKSLGWRPFNTGDVSFEGEAVTFRGMRCETMHLRDIVKPGIKIDAGSLNQRPDRGGVRHRSGGHAHRNRPRSQIAATLSGERQIEIPRFYRKSEAMLANVQRAKKPPTRTRSIHAKIANRRKDFLHKESRKISTNTGLSSLATPGRRNWPRPA